MMNHGGGGILGVPRLSKSQKVGVVFSAFFFLALLFNILDAYISQGMHTVIRIINSSYVWPLLPLSAAFLITAFFNNIVIKIFQVTVFLFVGVFFMLQNPRQNILTGVSVIIMAIALFYKYFSIRRTVYTTFGTIFVITVCVILSNIINELGWKYYFTRPLYAFAFLLLVYIIFEEDIRDLSRRHQRLLSERKQIEPLVIIGGKVRNVIHDMKNDLSLLEGSLSLIRSEDMMEEGIQSLQTGIDRLQDRINHLSYATGKNILNEIVTVDLSHMIEAIISVYRYKDDVRNDVFITSDIQKNIMFTCIPLEISSMVENLFKNAFDAVLVDSKARHVVSICARKDHDITIQIMDNGVGFDPGPNCAKESALDADCFRPGKTTKKDGSGIGMITVRDIIKKYNGNLLIESKTGEGTTVTVTLTAS